MTNMKILFLPIWKEQLSANLSNQELNVKFHGSHDELRINREDMKKHPYLQK